MCIYQLSTIYNVGIVETHVTCPIGTISASVGNSIERIFEFIFLLFDDNR